MGDTKPLLLSPRDTAQLLAISERTLWAMTDRGDLPHLKLNRLVRYDRADIERFIQTRKQNGRSEPACEQCGKPATHPHRDPLRSIDEPRCDYCCDKNCNAFNKQEPE